MQTDIAALARRLAAMLEDAGTVVTAAESCTGGWVAKALTDVPGSSAWFGYGFVTYSNRAKREMLGVEEKTLAVHGAVSEPVVVAMAHGALRRADADLAVAISGIAGPAGGSAEKPVGTVWFAWAARNGSSPTARVARLAGDRDAVRRQSVELALQGLIELAGG